MAKKTDIKPSDVMQFAVVVYEASATYMELTDFWEMYQEELKMLFFNPEVDRELMLNEKLKEQ